MGQGGFRNPHTSGWIKKEIRKEGEDESKQAKQIAKQHQQQNQKNKEKPKENQRNVQYKHLLLRKHKLCVQSTKLVYNKSLQRILVYFVTLVEEMCLNNTKNMDFSQGLTSTELFH